ncbi:hypothetical protein A1Q2_02308 [Trichosporon asahii var. asahii CBS 8904]|uniref:Uncharacterized protein n=1 Tax=Trichosporon asahii var. asahii (strain CBS 8904) TaxID=1220162 RepID=K1WQQ5_TRIAC|nr:hypothetical protein A1Q2_02308 [Trichosporon asahii var. asahii CBS 8904]
MQLSISIFLNSYECGRQAVRAFAVVWQLTDRSSLVAWTTNTRPSPYDPTSNEDKDSITRHAMHARERGMLLSAPSFDGVLCSTPHASMGCFRLHEHVASSTMAIIVLPLKANYTTSLSLISSPTSTTPSTPSVNMSELSEISGDPRHEDFCLAYGHVDEFYSESEDDQELLGKRARPRGSLSPPQASEATRPPQKRWDSTTPLRAVAHTAPLSSGYSSFSSFPPSSGGPLSSPFFSPSAVTPPTTTAPPPPSTPRKGPAQRPRPPSRPSSPSQSRLDKRAADNADSVAVEQGSSSPVSSPRRTPILTRLRRLPRTLLALINKDKVGKDGEGDERKGKDRDDDETWFEDSDPIETTIGRGHAGAVAKARRELLDIYNALVTGSKVFGARDLIGTSLRVTRNADVLDHIADTLLPPSPPPPEYLLLPVPPAVLRHAQWPADGNLVAKVSDPATEDLELSEFNPDTILVTLSTTEGLVLGEYGLRELGSPDDEEHWQAFVCDLQHMSYMLQAAYDLPLLRRRRGPAWQARAPPRSPLRQARMAASAPVQPPPLRRLYLVWALQPASLLLPASDWSAPSCSAPDVSTIQLLSIVPGHLRAPPINVTSPTPPPAALEVHLPRNLSKRAMEQHALILSQLRSGFRFDLTKAYAFVTRVTDADDSTNYVEVTLPAPRVLVAKIGSSTTPVLVKVNKPLPVLPVVGWPPS